LSALTALTLLFSVRLAQTGRGLDAVLAGVSLALAVLVKAIGALAAPIPLLALLVLGPLRGRWEPLALAYALRLPLARWALARFVATDNAQHLAQLFTGGRESLSARMGRDLGEGALWLWTWWTPPLALLGLAGAAIAVLRRERRGLLLALLAAYPLVAFCA